MNCPKKMSLSNLFRNKQDEMMAILKLFLSHSVAQGDNTENAWREFFKCFLPSRYCCDKIFVIDSKENFSEQIDIAIYDTYFSPLFFKSGENTYIPAESVYAVFEVKPVFSKRNFEYAQNKIASVRKLYRTRRSGNL